MFSPKNFRYYLILLLVTIFIGSCTYKSDDYYSPPTNPNPDSPDLQIVTLNLEEDTIVLYWDKDVVFNFKTGNQKILQVKFILDGNEYYTKDNNSGSFRFTHRILSLGIHYLSVEVYTETGSGSLAEELGYEQFVFSKEWVVEVYTPYAGERRFYVENGFLKLSWPVYKSSDFVAYRITRGDIFAAFELGRTADTTFTDSSYVGEGSVYNIQVIRANEELAWWGKISVYPDRPMLSFSANQENEYRLHWTKTPFYNAVEAVEIYKEYRHSFHFELIVSAANNSDTVYLISDAQFGDRKEYTIHVKPKYDNYLYASRPDYFDYVNSYYIGFGALEFSDVYQAGETDYLMLKNLPFRYSTEIFEIEERSEFSGDGSSSGSFFGFHVSKNGTYFSAYVNGHRDVYWGSTADLTYYKVTDLRHLTSAQYFPPILLSDVGTAIVRKRDFQNSTFYVYDFIRDAVIGSLVINNNVSLSGIRFSPNGDYIFYKQYEMKLLHFSNGVFTEMPFSEGSATFHDFMADEPGRYVRWENGVFYIKNCADFSTVYQFPLTDEMIVDIDYYQDQLLTYVEGYLYVRSLIDGTLLYVVPYNKSPTDYNKCTLLNNTILHREGMFYILQ